MKAKWSAENDAKIANTEYEKAKGIPLSRLFEQEEKQRLKERDEEDALKAKFARAVGVSSTVTAASRPAGSLTDDTLAVMKKWGAPINGPNIVQMWLDELVDGQIVEKTLEEAQAESGVKDYDQWGGF